MSEVFPNVGNSHLPPATTIGFAALELENSGLLIEGPLSERLIETAARPAVRAAMAGYKPPQWSVLAYPQLVLNGLKVTEAMHIDSSSDLVACPGDTTMMSAYRQRLQVSVAMMQWGALTRTELARRLIESGACVPKQHPPVDLTGEQVAAASLLSRGWERGDIVRESGISLPEWNRIRGGLSSALGVAVSPELITAKLFGSGQLVPDSMLHQSKLLTTTEPA